MCICTHVGHMCGYIYMVRVNICVHLADFGYFVDRSDG